MLTGMRPGSAIPPASILLTITGEEPENPPGALNCLSDCIPSWAERERPRPCAGSCTPSPATPVVNLPGRLQGTRREYNILACPALKWKTRSYAGSTGLQNTLFQKRNFNSSVLPSILRRIAGKQRTKFCKSLSGYPLGGNTTSKEIFRHRHRAGCGQMPVGTEKFIMDGDIVGVPGDHHVVAVFLQNQTGDPVKDRQGVGGQRGLTAAERELLLQYQGKALAGGGNIETVAKQAIQMTLYSLRDLRRLGLSGRGNR